MLRRGLILVAIVALFAPSTAGAQATTPLAACAAPPTPPCVESVKKNGVIFPYNDSSGTHDQASALTFTNPGDPTVWFNFNIYDETGDPDLSLADRYEITFNLGPGFTGETFARGHDVLVTRSTDLAGNALFTFAQNPVRTADDSCTGAGVCLMTATRTQPGYLDGWVDSLGYLDDPADAAAMRGFDLASNADFVSSPLELDYATNSIVLRVANAHFESDGVTPFIGSAEFKLPFPMLRRLYLVDDPASLTASAFSVTGAGPAASRVVTVDPTGHTVYVQLEGLTFSKRTLRINGDMTPRRPRELRAVRRSASRGVLRFKPALPRGSKVRGYVAKCVSAGGHVVRGSSLESPLAVTGLFAGTRYTCSVRAKSRAGLGNAARDTMPRFPG